MSFPPSVRRLVVSFVLVIDSTPARKTYHPLHFWLPPLPCVAHAKDLIPVTQTQPTTTAVTSSRTSLATPTKEGLMVMVWMWLIAPECSAARAKDSIDNSGRWIFPFFLFLLFSPSFWFPSRRNGRTCRVKERSKECDKRHHPSLEFSFCTDPLRVRIIT